MLDSETNRYSVINYIEENGLINPNDYHNKKGEVRRIELSDRVKIELSLTKLWEMNTLRRGVDKGQTVPSRTLFIK